MHTGVLGTRSIDVIAALTMTGMTLSHLQTTEVCLAITDGAWAYKMLANLFIFILSFAQLISNVYLHNFLSFGFFFFQS